MGRAPCCDKASVKKGPWSPEEDAKLKSYIEKYGTGGNWIALPQKIGLKRCGKSCRLRWLNYLRPNIKHGGFSEEEDNIICSLYISIGSRWSIIAAQLPGRTDNDIKNYWNTRLKKKLLGKQRKAQHARRGSGGGLKQDMKRGGGNDNIPNNIIASANCNNNFQQNPCWPELPVLGPIPYSNKEPRFDDHASIRKLLIKLGGKFADNNNQEQEQLLYNATNLQYSSGVSAISYSHHHQQLYDPNSVNVSTSASMEALKDTTSAHNIAQTQHTPVEAGIQMMQGEGSTSFPGGLQEIAYSDPQRLDDLEFLLADDTVNYRIETPCGDINGCLSDMNSQVYPPVAFNCDGVQQRLLQDHAFHELRFAGSVL